MTGEADRPRHPHAGGGRGDDVQDVHDLDAGHDPDAGRDDVPDGHDRDDGHDDSGHEGDRHGGDRPDGDRQAGDRPDGHDDGGHDDGSRPEQPNDDDAPQAPRTRVFAVDPPSPLPPPPAGLGRLGSVLHRLAEQQGAWPPLAPVQVRRFAADPARTADLSTDGAMEAGAAAADALVDAGVDLVVVCGGGARGPALVLLAALLGRDPVAAVGTTATSGWAAQVAAVRDGLRAARPHLWDPPALLEALEAVEVAELTGLLLQCAARRTPVLLSGAPDVWAAVLVAQRVTWATSSWLTAGCSPPPGTVAEAVAEARLVPLLDLELESPAAVELALGVLVGGLELAAGA